MTSETSAVTANKQNVTAEAGQGVTEFCDTLARARPLRGSVTVSHVTPVTCDVTERRDSDTAPLRSDGVTITRVHRCSVECSRLTVRHRCDHHRQQQRASDAAVEAWIQAERDYQRAVLARAAARWPAEVEL